MICSNQDGLFIWDLIRLQLIGKFDTSNVEIIGAEDNRILVKTGEGIFQLNSSTMKASKLFDAQAINIHASAIGKSKF